MDEYRTLVERALEVAAKAYYEYEDGLPFWEEATDANQRHAREDMNRVVYALNDAHLLADPADVYAEGYRDALGIFPDEDENPYG